MKLLLSFVMFVAGTLLIAKLLLSTAMIGQWISEINYSDGFARWRVRNHWVGIEKEEELWDYICLAIGAVISFSGNALLYRAWQWRSGNRPET